MKGLANFLLKEAGLKQVKRMLEAAAKSPLATKQRLAFARKPEEWGMEGVTNYYTQHASGTDAINNHLEEVTKRLEESRAARAKPSVETQAANRGWGNSVVHAPVPESFNRATRGLVDYQVKPFTPTAHAQDLEKLRQQTGRRWKEDSGILGVVDVYDLGKTRPKEHVGISSFHSSADSLKGDTKNWQHLPPDPKHPKSVRAKMYQAASAEAGRTHTDWEKIRDVTGPGVGVHLDPRFETVVSNTYLQDKKIGEFAQVPRTRGNHQGYSLDTVLKGSNAEIQDSIKNNLTGASRQSTKLYSEEQISSSALQQTLKSRQFNRLRTAPHSEYSTPLHFQPRFSDNTTQYRKPSSTSWEGASFPSDPRYVGKGRQLNPRKPNSEGDSRWTSELIPAVPTHYAGQLDISKGNIYYKTSNPKAFGKAMNKYLDKPIEGS